MCSYTEQSVRFHVRPGEDKQYQWSNEGGYREKVAPRVTGSTFLLQRGQKLYDNESEGSNQSFI